MMAAAKATKGRAAAPGKPAAVRSPKVKLRRAEKAEETRLALLRAAAEVVGRDGYAQASIAAITQAAGLAQGTFYLYFDSKQDVLDRVLPFVGDDLLASIRPRIEGAKSALEVEERSFRAAFDYLYRNPGFYRTLNEAEFAAPKGFDAHFQNLVSRYLASLKRSRKRGELQGYEPRELEVIAYMLMAVRFYVYLRFVKTAARKKTVPLPEWVIQAYMKFISHGLLYTPAREKRKRGR